MEIDKAIQNLCKGRTVIVVAHRLSAVSYTHLDVYKRQTSGNIGKISSVLSTDMVFIEEVSMSTIGNMMSYMPVSYTHLDVYKRQV